MNLQETKNQQVQLQIRFSSMGKTNAYKSKKKKKKRMGKNCKDKDYRYQCIPDSTIIQFKLHNNIIWEIRN